MNITGQDIFCIVQDRFGLVGKDDLAFTSRRFNQLTIEINVIDTGELMYRITEQFVESLFRKHIGIRIDTFLIELIQGKEGVADFIGRVREHQIDLLCAFGNTRQQYGETVA